MKRKYDEIIPHECNINYSGSSGGMESRLAVELLSNIWRRSNGEVAVGTIVADDDSTLKSNTVKKSNLGYSRTMILKQKTNVDGCSDRIRLIPKLTLMLLLQLGNRGQLGLGKLCSMPV